MVHERFEFIPSATRLRMSLTSSPGHTKKFEFFHWLTKKNEMKIRKLYASHFTSGRTNRTNGDHS